MTSAVGGGVVSRKEMVWKSFLPGNSTLQYHGYGHHCGVGKCFRLRGLLLRVLEEVYPRSGTSRR